MVNGVVGLLATACPPADHDAWLDGWLDESALRREVLDLASGRVLPALRDPLTLALSDDGLVYRELYYLVGGRHVDYPHVIEHDGSLFIAFAGGKHHPEHPIGHRST